MQRPSSQRGARVLLTVLAPALCQCLAGYMIFLYAPTEATMGDAQRVVYLHVAVAWCGLAGCGAMAASAAVYLLTRRLAWDHWSQAAAEVSWLCVTLTLVTGSLWAHEAWGAWWVWEPRLTSSLLLWLIYAGMFLVRAEIDNPHQRARVAAILAILSAADLPLVILATRWFRGIHPVSPKMDPRMVWTLLVSVTGFTVFYMTLICLRRRHLGQEERLLALEAGL